MKHQDGTFTWIIVGACVGVGVLLVVTVVFTRLLMKRNERRRSRYREEYLRKQQKTAREVEEESNSLARQPQKLIREEVERLQTFSPDRKIFYADPDEILPVPKNV